MKRALGFLIFGVLAIGAVYLSVTRLSPFTEAQEGSAGVADTAVTVVESSPTVIPSPTLLPSPTLIPATVAPPTLPPSPTVMPSPTVEPPTATLEPTIIPATELVASTATLPVEIAAVTEVLPTEMVAATDALAVMVTTEVVPTSEPTLDTSAVDTVQPTAEFTPVTHGNGHASMQGNTGRQLSVGTPIVQPPLLPTATIEVVQPTPIPVEVQPTIEAPLLPTTTIEVVQPTPVPIEVQPTIEATLLPTLAQITGTISAPLAADLVLTLPDGATMNATTASDGTFSFANLQPGAYHLQASAAGFLTSQIDFDLADGQSFALPPALLRPGDTNHDNLIDVRDAVLIAANFGGPAVSPETDLNRDGMIDIRDLTLLGAVFGQSGPTSWG